MFQGADHSHAVAENRRRPLITPAGLGHPIWTAGPVSRELSGGSS